MINVKKSGIFLGCGFLLVLLGSMAMNGYFGFLLWPAEYHHDAFIGTVPHLLIGLIPWLIGIVLITIGAKKAWHILMIGSVGIGGGILINLLSFLNATDYEGVLGFLAIFALGTIFAAAARMILSISKTMVHRTA
jgi:hypothetical protein